ncbi:hypothetical protein [Streptomyces sp. NBC_01006]|uniref:hypothetical protein n=1 Tax=Streptomyces sp. NBC_01006 TaxID=2903716 RepID=UPI003863B5EB|nr:hypothetical protein OG509_38605 [Streptomyces sp. NBC_01006]
MPVNIVDIGPPSTIASGRSLIETYFFGDFYDVGVCYGTLATEPKFLAWLDVTDQGRVGSIRSIGGVPHLDLRNWQYTMTVTNRSNATVSYNIRIATLTGG